MDEYITSMAEYVVALAERVRVLEQTSGELSRRVDANWYAVGCVGFACFAVLVYVLAEHRAAGVAIDKNEKRE
jgi:hypothetical protein